MTIIIIILTSCFVFPCVHWEIRTTQTTGVISEVGDFECSHTEKHVHVVFVLVYLQYLASVGGAVDVLAGLVHSQGDAVQQDHHHADSFKPGGNSLVKFHNGSE